MSFHEDLKLVIDTDGISTIVKAHTVQDALYEAIEKENREGGMRAWVMGVMALEAIEAYVESRAEEIRDTSELSLADMINETIEEWRRSR